MANIGDKYIVEIEAIYGLPDCGIGRYALKGLNNIAIDEGALNNLRRLPSAPVSELEKEYQRGLNDAWAATRKLFLRDKDGLNAFSPDAVPEAILNNYSAIEAISKIKAYEEQQKEKIKVGDEVRYIPVSGKLHTAIVVSDADNEWTMVDENGTVLCCSIYASQQDRPKKTGRHFPALAAILSRKETIDHV